MRLAAILATAGIYMLIEFAPAYQREHALAGADASNAPGVVERVSRRKPSGKDAFYEVSYHFGGAGHEIRGQYECQCEELAGYRPGQPIVIRYVQSEPDLNRPAVVHYSLKWLLSLVVVAAGCLIAAPIVVLVQRARADDS